jgi:hypothetical protein
MVFVGDRRVARNDAWTELDEFSITFTVAFLPWEIALAMTGLRVRGPRAFLVAVAVLLVVGHATWTGLPRVSRPATRRAPSAQRLIVAAIAPFWFVPIVR